MHKVMAVALLLGCAMMMGQAGAAAADLAKALAKAQWRVRDVAAGSAFKAAMGQVTEPNLKLVPVKTERGSACTVIDTTAADRQPSTPNCC